MVLPGRDAIVTDSVGIFHTRLSMAESDVNTLGLLEVHFPDQTPVIQRVKILLKTITVVRALNPSPTFSIVCIHKDVRIVSGLKDHLYIPFQPVERVFNW